MKCIQAEFESAQKKISIKPDATVENWVDICTKFNDDVSRICDVSNIEDYTGLFECFDDANKQFFYLVKEDKSLYRMKHRHFYDNLGLK